jgi:cytochrome c
MGVISLFCALAVISAPTLFASTISAAAQDKDKQVAIGELVFYACRGCHILGDNRTWGRNGPHLNDLFGRKPGGLPDYKYSDSMVAFGEDKIWDKGMLTTFLHDPRGVVKGSKMAFPGLKKDEEIQAVLAYLATFDPDGTAPK